MKLFRFIKSKTLWANVLIILVTCALIFWGINSWLDSYTRHGENIVVPSLSRMDYDEAVDALEQRELFAEIMDTSEFDPDFPRGSIINQYPEEGATVKKGRAIRLTVNPMKARKVEIPMLIEKTKRRAIYDLESKGFKVGELSYVPYLGKDVVVDVKVNGQSVKDKEKFEKGTSIELVLGEGVGKGLVSSPYLRFSSLEEAVLKLQKSSLNLGTVIYDEDLTDTVTAVIYNQRPVPSLSPSVSHGTHVDIWLTNDYTKIPNDSLQFLHPELVDTTSNATDPTP